MTMYLVQIIPVQIPYHSGLITFIYIITIVACIQRNLSCCYSNFNTISLNGQFINDLWLFNTSNPSLFTKQRVYELSVCTYGIVYHNPFAFIWYDKIIVLSNVNPLGKFIFAVLPALPVLPVKIIMSDLFNILLHSRTVKIYFKIKKL